MRVYESDNIRNIAIVGHGAAGKTTLTSAMLFDSGAVSRLGRVEDGNTVTDWEDEEIERKITISTGVAHCEWNKKKINILDTPGYRPFLTETKLALRVADAALVVIDSVAGVEVQTEKVWEFCDEFGLPRIIILNKMDRDNASFERALESVAEVFGRAPVPIQIPLGAEKDFAGVVSILNQRAYRYEKDHSGKFQEIEIPAEYRDEAARAREKLVEMVAEGSDELMEKFFSEGTLEGPDLLAGLRGSVRQRNLVPVLCASASLNIAIAQILDAIVEFVPSPAQIGKVQGIHPQSKEPIERKVSVQE
ncbi:MAG: elongation factor G, partial [Acidobacteria bacterium]